MIFLMKGEERISFEELLKVRRNSTDHEYLMRGKRGRMRED